MLSGLQNINLISKKGLESRDLVNQISWFSYHKGSFQKDFFFFFKTTDSHPNYTASLGLSVNIKPFIVLKYLSTAEIF